MGHNTGALCSDWTPTEEGYDIEEVEAHHRHAYRLIYKVRNNRNLFNHLYEKRNMDDDPDLVVVSYGTPSRVVNTAVDQGPRPRHEGRRSAADQPVAVPGRTLQPRRPSIWWWSSTGTVSWSGRCSEPRLKDSKVHFLGTCGDLPTIPDLKESFEKLLKNQPLTRKGWVLEAW